MGPLFWCDATDSQKAKLSYIVMKGHLDFLNREHPNREVMKRMIHKALDDTTDTGRRLVGVLQEAGDVVLSTEELEGRPFKSLQLEHFLEKVPEWKDYDKAPTIFNHDIYGVRPVLRIQEAWSPICYILTSVNQIHYSKTIREKKAAAVRNTDYDEIGTREKFSLNVLRYIRNFYSEEDSYNHIFVADGGYATVTIDALIKTLLSNVPADAGVTRSYDLAAKRPEAITNMVACVSDVIFDCGAGIIESFQVFHDFLHSGEVTFTGNYAEKQKLDPKKYPNINHVVLVTGARSTGAGGLGGGAMFQIQNTWPHQAFAEVGLDLLQSMGAIQLYFIREDVPLSAFPASLQLPPAVAMAQSLNSRPVPATQRLFVNEDLSSMSSSEEVEEAYNLEDDKEYVECLKKTFGPGFFS